MGKRLDQAYQIILPLANRSHQPSISTSKEKEDMPPKSNANRYDFLDEESLENSLENCEIEPQPENITEALESPKQFEQVLLDDDLGEHIEISLFIYVRVLF